MSQYPSSRRSYEIKKMYTYTLRKTPSAVCRTSGFVLLSLMTIYCGDWWLPVYIIIFFQIAEYGIRYIHTVRKKKSKTSVTACSYFGSLLHGRIDRYGRTCACLFFILYFLPFPSDRADCGIHFGRRICVCTPQVEDTSIKVLYIWLCRQIIRRTNSGDMISDLNRARAGEGTPSGCGDGDAKKLEKKVIAVDGIRKKSKQSVYIYSVIYFI